MSDHDTIDKLLREGISIIELEISQLKIQQDSDDGLTKQDIDKLLECMKTMVVVRRDWRIDEKEKIIDTKTLSNEELEAAILAEAEKIKSK